MEFNEIRKVRWLKYIDEGGLNMSKNKNQQKNMLLEKVSFLSQKALSLLYAKNHDYAGIEDPYKNFKLVEMLEVTDMKTGIVVRMADKLARVSRLLKHSPQVKESIVDTLLDLSNYALILASLFITEKDISKTKDKKED